MNVKEKVQYWIEDVGTFINPVTNSIVDAVWCASRRETVDLRGGGIRYVVEIVFVAEDLQRSNNSRKIIILIRLLIN